MATASTPDRTAGRKRPKNPVAALPAPAATDAKPLRGRRPAGSENRLTENEPLQEAVLRRAIDMGLMGTEVHLVGARLPTKLLEQAKKRTGIVSITDLMTFALANVAVEDDFAKAFVAARGRVDRDLDIGF